MHNLDKAMKKLHGFDPEEVQQAHDQIDTIENHRFETYMDIVQDSIDAAYHFHQKVTLPIGWLHAKAMIIGEAGGPEEGDMHMPFVGASGHLLTLYLNRIGIKRKNLYFTNILKYFPEESGRIRPPSKWEEEEYNWAMPILYKEIAMIQPKAILCIGGEASKRLTEKHDLKITQEHGTWHKINGIDVMITMHPSYLLRSAKEYRYEQFEKDLQEFFQFARS